MDIVLRQNILLLVSEQADQTVYGEYWPKLGPAIKEKNLPNCTSRIPFNNVQYLSLRQI